VARVVALIPDLLFGSRVYAALAAAGHEVELLGDSDRLGERLVGTAVLVVDLTREELDGVGVVESLVRDGVLGGGDSSGDGETSSPTRTLGFYSHVEADVRTRAERAGFDLVVPRSRMAREGAELVNRLAQG
jgi:hypothetical protein